jgi:hypothetical protein
MKELPAIAIAFCPGACAAYAHTAFFAIFHGFLSMRLRLHSFPALVISTLIPLLPIKPAVNDA